jgi:hypothetical protein
LPQIPCMDRWFDRAEAFATCGADGAWIFPAFRPFYGTSAAEINKFVWWKPVSEREALLNDLARRIAGAPAAAKLRDAWKETSTAVACSPELPTYYTGPYYLGPMHPMCADATAAVPPVFYGQYLFHAEIKDAEGLKKEPTFITAPRGNVSAFAASYREMKNHLERAAANIRATAPLIDDRHRLTFDAEAIATLWFYHTARTHSNFYESCQMRDSIAELLKKKQLTAEEKSDAAKMIARWKAILEDELANTKEALPLVAGDMRLDPYYGGDHTFSHGQRMIEAKLQILKQEIAEHLPSLAAKLSQ